MSIDPSAAFKAKAQQDFGPTGKEPLLGGKLHERAVWVDERVCIGCRYCAHVATNTFVIEPSWGRSRAIRQDGDSKEIIQEAIETCPVNCIHWVDFEDLHELRSQINQSEFQALGMLPKFPKRNNPRKT